MTEKEIAALKRENDELKAEQLELEAKRKQLKLIAEQRRDDMDALRRAETDADGISARAEEIKKRIAEIEQSIAAVPDNPQNKEEVIRIMEKNNGTTERGINKALVRTAFAKLVRGEKLEKREMEHYLRSLANPSVDNGQSATTTSTIFAEVSADSIGINNGGIFIPETVLLDILREETLESPILNDVLTTAIRGMIKYPYLKRKDVAKKKAELDQTDSQNLEWDIISGRTGNYTTSIIITFEAMAQTIDEFVPYLMELIRDSMRELVIDDYIYGTGELDSVRGLTNDSITSNYTAAATIQSILETAVTKLPVRKRKGSKFYLAADLHDKYVFAKNSDGDYIHPVFSGVTAFNFATYPVALEPALKEGEFIFGNVGKNYKANIIKPMELGLDVSNKKRINEYTAHAMINATPVPGSFVYGKKSV